VSAVFVALVLGFDTLAKKILVTAQLVSSGVITALHSDRLAVIIELVINIVFGA
jgi:hypothetical protein